MPTKLPDIDYGLHKEKTGLYTFGAKNLTVEDTKRFVELLVELHRSRIIGTIERTTGEHLR